MLEVIIYFGKVIENGDAIDKPIIEKLSDVLLVFFSLKAVAYNVRILSNLPFGIQASHQRDIKGGRGLDVDVIF
jgi:hypothetical protein